MKGLGKQWVETSSKGLTISYEMQIFNREDQVERFETAIATLSWDMLKFLSETSPQELRSMLEFYRRVTHPELIGA